MTAWVRRLLRDLGLWFLYFPLRWLVLILPVPLVQAAGTVSGSVHAALAPLVGGIRVRRNMEPLLGRARAAEAFRQYLVGKHRTLLEHFVISSRGPSAVDRLTGEIHGLEHLDALRDKGAVLALFHFGNIRMLSALGHRGYPLVQLLNRTAAHAGRGHSRFLARKVRDLKVRMDRAMPARFVHWEPGLQAREIYKVPATGELLLIHLDGSRGGSFGLFDFLGGRAPFATGAARIANRMGSGLLPVFCVTRADGRHDIHIEPPVSTEGGAEQMTRQCVETLERLVLEHPEQWWTWARLELDVNADGTIRIEPRAAAGTHDQASYVEARS